MSCDLAVVGVGVTPATGLAEAAGITADNGIVVDEFLQTSSPHVFAAGAVPPDARASARRAAKHLGDSQVRGRSHG